jgi:hypothetical protein
MRSDEPPPAEDRGCRIVEHSPEELAVADVIQCSNHVLE